MCIVKCNYTHIAKYFVLSRHPVVRPDKIYTFRPVWLLVF